MNLSQFQSQATPDSAPLPQQIGIQNPTSKKVIIQTNNDVYRYFGEDINQFKDLFPARNLYFLLQSCKQNPTIFGETCILDPILSDCEYCLRPQWPQNVYDEYYEIIYKQLKLVFRNKSFTTIIYNDYIEPLSKYTSVQQRIAELKDYIATHIEWCIKDNLEILFPQGEQELIVNHEQDISERVEKLLEVVTKSFYNLLHLTEKEASLVETMISNWLATKLSVFTEIIEDWSILKIKKK